MRHPNRRQALHAGLGAAAAGLPQALRAQTVLHMVNTVYPPFVCPPGHPVGEGLDVEIAREALQRAGYAMRVDLVPWKRALLMLERGEADFTTTISRREDRDRFLDWTPPYRNGAAYRFYARAGRALRIQSLADLTGLRLGTVSGFHYPPKIIQHPGVQVIPGRDLNSLVQMLLAGRSDALVVTALAGAWEIRERRFEAHLQLQPFEYASDSPNYFAFSRARALDKARIAVSAALAELQRDGSLARIEKRYWV